jgi:hypothetical protein
LADPLQPGDADAVEGAFVQSGEVVLALVQNDLRGGDGQRAEEVPLVLVDAEHGRIGGVVDAGLGGASLAGVALLRTKSRDSILNSPAK